MYACYVVGFVLGIMCSSVKVFGISMWLGC